MRDTGTGLSEEAELLIVEMDAMGIPDIMPGPPKALHVFKRPHVEMLCSVRLLIFSLSQMRVKANAEAAGKFCGFPEQVRAHAERRAGGKGDLMHRVLIRVMESADSPLR